MMLKKEELEEGESFESEEELGEETAEETAVVGGRELDEADRPEYEVRKHQTARRPCYPLKPK